MKTVQREILARTMILKRAAGRGITFVRIADVKWALILWWDIGKG